jgi:hypothetical protein
MSTLPDPRLARLLEHPAIWRGRSAARTSTIPTGLAVLDACLPGNGWPAVGLVEILLSSFGAGELYLLLPALALLTGRAAARWCAWIAPPLEPFAPALAAHGVSLSQLLVVRTPAPQWACEQALGSGACDSVLAWMDCTSPRAIRRLQLATEHGRTLGFLLRSLTPRARREPSGAALRIAVEPLAAGARVVFLKSRGGARGAVDVPFRAATDA